MVKQDLADMFLNFKIHPSRWVLFGFQHLITGQSYVYPCLPFGFRLSPTIACSNTQLEADIITEEVQARAEGNVCRKALECVPRRAVWKGDQDCMVPVRI